MCSALTKEGVADEMASSAPRADAVHPTSAAWPAAIAAILVGNSCAMVQPLLVGTYVDAMHLDLSTAGYISALELAGLAAAAIFIARVVHRWSPARLGVMACIVFALANVASAWAVEPWALVISRVTAGCAAGVALAAGSAIAARSKLPERVFAFAFAGVTLYGLIFFPNAAALTEAFGVVGLYGAKTVLGVVAAGIVSLSSLRLRRAHDSVPRAHAPAEVRSTSDRRENRQLRLRVLACGLILYVGHTAVWTYEERIGAGAGLSLAEIGRAFGLASIAGLLGALLAAALGTRFGRTIPQLLALGLSVLAALMIIVSGSVLSFTVSACLIAFTWFYGVPYLAGLAAAVEPAGRLAGELSAMMSAGSALGPFVAASIVGASFSPVGWLAAMAYIGCCVLILGPSRRMDASGF